MNPETALETVQQTLTILIPEIILLLAAIALMTASPFFRATCRTWGSLAAAALAASLLALLAVQGRQTGLYSAVALNDDLGFYGRLVVLLTGFIILALAHDEPSDDRAGEFFGALLMINAGAMVVATANDLILLFVGLELVSMPTYLLLYLSRRTITTQESATKYFYLSIFASGMLLFGLAYLYGIAGISNLKALAAVSSSLPAIPHQELGLIAVLFVLAGLSFRVAAVPFHFYAPDVYQGSPTVTGRASVVGAEGGRIRRDRPGPHGGDLGEGHGRPAGAEGDHDLLGRRGGHDDARQHRGLAPEQPQAAAGLLVDRPRRLSDDRRDRGVRQRTQERHVLLRLRGHLLLPRRLCADDPRGLRRHHRAEDGAIGRSRPWKTSPAWDRPSRCRRWRWRSACSASAASRRWPGSGASSRSSRRPLPPAPRRLRPRSSCWP